MAVLIEHLVEEYETPKFSAFITNLGKYNEGELVGDWVSFPIERSEFDKKLAEIGIGSTDDFGNPYEEWFVTDYELEPSLDWDWRLGFVELGEYPSYDDLQNFGELIESITNIEAISNICEATGGSISDAVDGYEIGRYIYYPGISSWSDLGHLFIEELYGGDPSYLRDVQDYFDYEMFGRDLDFDEYEDSDGNIISAGEYFCGTEDASDYDIGLACVEATGYPEDISTYFDYEEFGESLSGAFTLTSDGAVEETT